MTSPRMRLRLARTILRRSAHHALEAAASRCTTPPTDRAERHLQSARQLVRDGFAYACYCTEPELAAMHALQRLQGRPEQYERRCLSLYAEHRATYEAQGRAPAIRFRVPEGLAGSFQDLVRGEVPLASDRLDDFVLVTRDGQPTAVFASVVDSVARGITHHVRDEARLLDTMRELLLYDALGVAPPRFAHLRMAARTQGPRPEDA